MAGTLTFLNGVTSRTITVPTKADTLLEGAETFTVTLSNPGGGATLGAPAAAVVTIVDDETPAPSVRHGDLHGRRVGRVGHADRAAGRADDHRRTPCSTRWPA